MGGFEGECSTEIGAGIGEVFDLLCDVERVPEWQPDVTSIECLERDARGRPVLVRSELETVVRATTTVVRFAFHDPHRVTWVMEEGDVKAFDGSWTLTELSARRTLAEYAVTIDFGRLGMLVRGPAGRAVKGAVVSSMPAKLKAFAEAHANLRR